MRLTVSQRQQVNLSPRLQQAVRLLQMSSIEFAQEIHAALAVNPFLDEDEPANAESDADVENDDGGEDSTLDSDEGEWNEDREFNAALPASGNGQQLSTSDDSPLDRLPAQATLAEHLHSQLSLQQLPWRDLSLARVIVESLDDDGYLRTGFEEMAEIVDFDPPAGPDEWQIALRRVQSLEPAGVAARDLAECLLLQLPSVTDEAMRSLMRTIVCDHLPAAARNDVTLFARQLGQPQDKVAAALAAIRRLDPRPAARFSAPRIDYLVPDIVVHRSRRGWQVALNPAVVPRVRLHEVYAEMYQREQKRLNPELSSHLRDARWTLRNIEQRFATILGVARAIVARQPHFFEFGPLGMKPLSLREIAEEVGVHESTVSRVTNNKYMSTPAGTFELKYFFSRTFTSAGGAEFSNTAIRRLVKEMLEQETKARPLTDAEIARQLAAQGVVLCRRTVTKYRHLLQVESASRRRITA